MAGYNLKQIWSKYLEKATIISLIAGLTTFFGFSIITVGNAGLTPALPTSLIAQTGIIDVVALFVIAYLLGMVWSKYREEPVTDALLAIFISLGILGFLTVGATNPYNLAVFVIIGALSGAAAIMIGEYL